MAPKPLFSEISAPEFQQGFCMGLHNTVGSRRRRRGECENGTPRKLRATQQWPRRCAMAISKDLKDRAQKTREDGVFTLKLDEGVSLATLVSFAQDCFRA